MTALPDRPHTALLVIDMQRDVVAGAPRLDQVVENIATLVERARTARTPIIWVQHADEDMPEGSAGWQYVPELQRNDDEPLIHKAYGDSFAGTELEECLAERRVGHLVVTGAQTDACIRATLHGSMARGYDSTLVSDAHTTEDLREWGSPISPEQAIAYTNLYWGSTNAPGCAGSTAATAEIVFTPREG